MSKRVLSEGMIDTVIGWFMQGKINKATQEFLKDPRVKQAYDNLERSKREFVDIIKGFETIHKNK